MTWWELTLWSIPAGLPALAIWRWRVRRAQARMVAEMMAYRREKFGGAIKVRGQDKAQPLERPRREDR